MDMPVIIRDVVYFSNTSAFDFDKECSYVSNEKEKFQSLLREYLDKEQEKYSKYPDFCKFAVAISNKIIEGLSQSSLISDAVLEFTSDMSVFFSMKLLTGNYAYLEVYYNKDKYGENALCGTVFILADSNKNKIDSAENCENSPDSVWEFLSKRLDGKK